MSVLWCVLTLMVTMWSCVVSGGDAGMKAFADMLGKWKAEEKASDAAQSIREETGMIYRGKDTTLTSANKKVLVDKHNSLRRNEPDQANMEMLIWNDYLASMADDWSRKCVWKHGQPYRDPATWPFRTFGQNLYATTDDVIDLENAVQNWYDERDYYDYETKSCNPPPGRAQTCGHYTQVTWSSTRQVGCAVMECPTLDQPSPTKPLKNALYLVCTYGPAGNVKDQLTGNIGFNYLKGPSCSLCESGWCKDKLCNSNCLKPSTICACPLKCAHGQLQASTCQCRCDPGWSKTSCSEPCIEVEPRCKTGWHKSSCADPEFSALVQWKCPVLCGLCQVSPETRIKKGKKPKVVKTMEAHEKRMDDVEQSEMAKPSDDNKKTGVKPTTKKINNANKPVDKTSSVSNKTSAGKMKNAGHLNGTKSNARKNRVTLIVFIVASFVIAGAVIVVAICSRRGSIDDENRDAKYEELKEKYGPENKNQRPPKKSPSKEKLLPSDVSRSDSGVSGGTYTVDRG